MVKPFLKLICLNLEGDRHLPAVREFLSREKAEVICLQEVYLADAKMFAAERWLFYRFAPMVIVTNPQQRNDLQALFEALEKLGECVFCGDFNAPRGRTVWAKLAEKYVDNIPPDVASTLDPQLHKNKTISYVVDGIFSTTGFEVSEVRVVGDLSDHKALVAQVSRGMQ